MLAGGIAIGAITFSGSVIAFLKLNGNMSGSPIMLPGRHIINLGTLAAIIGLVGYSIPIFWLGLMLITYVALPTGWFPVGGWPDSTQGRFLALVLPSLNSMLALRPATIGSMQAPSTAKTTATFVP